jgi:hypothetical protein
MSLLVIRLHPLEPTTGANFQAYLEGLEIKVAERSFADPKGTVNVLGTARSSPPPASIVQHVDLFPFPTLRPAATALILVPDPFPFIEYRTPDLVLTITRTVPPNPAQTIIHREINFNVDVAPGAAVPAPNPIVYESIVPTSLYLGLPKPLVGLGPGVAVLEVPTDGTPPPFQAVLNAMNVVLAADPNAPVDLTKLTVEQCRHIAREIVSNRTLSPLPVPPPGIPLDELYDGGNETERKQFEAELLTYYAVHNTRAEVLTKFIYSVSAALACEKLTEDVTQVGFTFPILPGLAPQGGKIPEATVVITQ